MKKTLTLVALLSATLTYGQQFSLLPSNGSLINLEHQVEATTSEYTQINGNSYTDFTKSHAITSMEAGAPALPFFSESVIIPNQGKASLIVNHDGFTEFNNVLVAPGKGNLKRNVNPSDVPYTFGAAYNTDAFFPGELAVLGEPFNIRNTRGATVSVSPYQYNPVTKTLRVYHNITVSVNVEQSQTGINELTTIYGQNDVFSEIYHNQYLNADLVFGRYTPLEESGDMLIIAADNLLDEIEPLAKWKIESGIQTTVVGTSTAGSTDSQIKSYIDNFYSNNPNLIYVLLVGDHGDLPSHTYGTSGWGESLWSDSYFGMLTGNDYYPELFVGRLSGNASQVTTQVLRTLEYEKTPASGDWMTKAIGLASDEGAGYGDDGEADWQHNRNMRTKLMNYGYTTVHEFYDGSHGGDDANGDPTPQMIKPEVTAGIGLFNYTGHGDQNSCVTGNFSSTHINQVTNNGKYPFVISVACNNGSFTAGTCFSESWMWATNAGTPTGAISACGSSILMAWAEPMQVQDEMTELIAETYANNRKTTLGGLFYNSQMSMLEDYNASGTAKEVMQTWVMFGDPSTLFRNKVSMDMTVTHWGNLPMGATSVDVNCNIEDAKVALVQDGVILGVGMVSGGVVNFNFPALTSNEPIIVTGTKQNYIPYQGVIVVEGGPTGIDENAADAVSIYPNPANDFVNVQWTGASPEMVELRDLSGKLVYSLNTANVSGSTLTIPTGELASGVYVMHYVTANQAQTKKLVIR